jgi:hypothetical protein
MSKISELSDGGVIQGGDTLIAVRSGGNVKVTYGGSTTANIDGGTIDGTVIGGSTAAAGTFTTGQFNTSVNVDGTVTADGLTVDGNNAGLTITGPSSQLMKIATTSSLDKIAFAAGDGTVEAMRIDSTGDISFYEDTGTTAKMVWKASDERLGINTSSPQGQISASNAAGTDVIEIDTTSAGFSRFMSIDRTTGDEKYLQIRAKSIGFALDSSVDDITIDSSGNVGINTTTPDAKLEIGGAGEGIILASPDGTRYEITVANGGTLTVTAV